MVCFPLYFFFACSPFFSATIPDYSGIVTPSSFPTSVRSGDPVAAVESDPVARSSSSSSMLPASAPPTPCSVDFTATHSVDIFYDNIVKSRGTGIRSSCFSLDPVVLHRLLQMHGVAYTEDACVRELQHSILRHLLTGDCVRSSELSGSLPRTSRHDVVCTQLASPFPSGTDMSVAFVRRVVDDVSTDQKLTMPKLSALASAIVNQSFSPEPFSSPNNIKRDAMRLFNRLLAIESLDDDHNLLPSRLESYSKSELQSMARSHSISFERRTSVSDLRSLIVSHVLSARCLQNIDASHWDKSPKGCASSLKTFLSSGLQVESSSFIVFALSKCCNNMSLKPLRRVLTFLDIAFDATESLNQLRRRLRLYVSRMQKASANGGTDLSWRRLFADLVQSREHWPQQISSSAKDKLRSKFLDMTGYAALKTGVCACCAESALDSSLCLVNVSKINLDLL